MGIIFKHKTAFVVLLIAVVCLVITFWATEAKPNNDNGYMDNTFLDNSVVIEDSEIITLETNSSTSYSEPVQVLDESGSSNIPWQYKGYVSNAGEYVEGREIYGLDLTITYNKEKDIFEAEAGMGDNDKIKYFELSNNKLILAVPTDIEIKSTIYGIHFNRKDVNGVSIPENWCSYYDIGAKITKQDDVKLIEMTFNRSYGKGELINLDVEFGLLD